MKKICLDAGVLGIYFSKDRTAEIKSLMDEIKAGKVSAYMLKHVLIEAYFHICKDQGVTEATTQITNFQSQYPINLVDLDDPLIRFAFQMIPEGDGEDCNRHGNLPFRRWNFIKDLQFIP